MPNISGHFFISKNVYNGNMRLDIKKRRILVAALVIFLFFLFLNLTGASKGLREFFYEISSPIQRNFWQGSQKISNFLKPIFIGKDLNKENEELNKINQELFSKLVFFQGLEEENKTLRQALNLDLQKEFRLVLSKIIGKDTGQDFILINKGSGDGISKNMPVITEEKILVGKISEVYSNFSKVMLIYHQGNTGLGTLTEKSGQFSFDVKIIPGSDFEMRREEIPGVAKGNGFLKLIIELIPQDEDVREGDLVVTDIFGGLFPKGLLVGKIKNIRKSDTQPFQEAEVSPFLNLDKINSLFVITEY